MTDWLMSFYESLTWSKFFVGFGLFLFSLAVSTVAVAVVMVKIPPEYFSETHKREFMTDKPWLFRWGAVIAKNVLGVFLIALGIVLSLPGVPGQGFLTILLGLIMLDIPGKRPIEAKIISRPAVRNAINNLRAKYKKPPLILD